MKKEPMNLKKSKEGNVGAGGWFWKEKREEDNDVINISKL